MLKRLKFYFLIGVIYLVVTQEQLLFFVRQPWVKGVIFSVIGILLLVAVFITIRRKKQGVQHKNDNSLFL